MWLVLLLLVGCAYEAAGPFAAQPDHAITLWIINESPDELRIADHKSTLARVMPGRTECVILEPYSSEIVLGYRPIAGRWTVSMPFYVDVSPGWKWRITGNYAFDAASIVPWDQCKP